MDERNVSDPGHSFRTWWPEHGGAAGDGRCSPTLAAGLLVFQFMSLFFILHLRLKDEPPPQRGPNLSDPSTASRRAKLLLSEYIDSLSLLPAELRLPVAAVYSRLQRIATVWQLRASDSSPSICHSEARTE